MYLEISNPMDYHVALYIRLSKEDENEGPSQSVQNQESLLREFVQQHRLSVFDTYVDDGWSGTSFDRPSFQRMIGDIETKKVNMVITKDLSRLGRDYIMTGHYMERYFPEHRVRYISLLDGIDTGVDSTANDITPFRAIMNDMYAKDISKKIKSVKRDKQRKGQFIGGKPVYGYKMHPTEKNKIVIDEEVAPVVRRIFALALSGMSCRKIATTLNEEGVPTPATYCGWKVGNPGPYTGLWSSERISEMLRNETYIGNMVQGRMVKISYKSKKCLRQSPENWVVVEGTHESIIDPETLQPLPDGEYGELVFTCIGKEALPLVRYRTRDICSLTHEACECGRTLVRMSKPRGRTDDMLIIRGVNVFPSQVEHVILSLGMEPNYQIIVERKNNLDTMEVCIEMSPQMFSDSVKGLEGTEAKIEAALHTTLGLSAKVRLVEPNSIPRSEGKAKRVIDKRKI